MTSKYISDDLKILFDKSGREISDKELIDALIMILNIF